MTQKMWRIDAGKYVQFVVYWNGEHEDSYYLLLCLSSGSI